MASVKHVQVGAKIGKLTMLEHIEGSSKEAVFLCKCDCGSLCNLTAIRIATRKVASCGCASLRENHRLSRTPEYNTWVMIKRRTSNPNCPEAKNYVLRGISMCDRWRSSFSSFFADMGKRPSPKHSLDRIDNNGDYTPENCRWATDMQQANNSRSNSKVLFEGKEMTVAELSRKTGISAAKLYKRVRKGYPMSDVLYDGTFRRSGTKGKFGLDHPGSMPVVINDVFYGSISLAAKALNGSPGGIAYACRKSKTYRGIKVELVSFLTSSGHLCAKENK